MKYRVCLTGAGGSGSCRDLSKISNKTPWCGKTQCYMKEHAQERNDLISNLAWQLDFCHVNQNKTKQKTAPGTLNGFFFISATRIFTRLSFYQLRRHSDILPCGTLNDTHFYHSHLFQTFKSSGKWVRAYVLAQRQRGKPKDGILTGSRKWRQRQWREMLSEIVASLVLKGVIKSLWSTNTQLQAASQRPHILSGRTHTHTHSRRTGHGRLR